MGCVTSWASGNVTYMVARLVWVQWRGKVLCLQSDWECIPKSGSVLQWDVLVHRQPVLHWHISSRVGWCPDWTVHWITVVGCCWVTFGRSMARCCRQTESILSAMTVVSCSSLARRAESPALDLMSSEFWVDFQTVSAGMEDINSVSHNSFILFIRETNSYHPLLVEIVKIVLCWPLCRHSVSARLSCSGW